MKEQVEKQAEHTPLVKFAITMGENWHTLRQKYGADERAWAKLAKPELEEMPAEIAGWVQTCEDILAALPSPPAKNNIADDWLDALDRKNKVIQALIDRASA